MITPNVRAYRPAADEAIVAATWKDTFWSLGFLRWAAKRDYYRQMNRVVEWLVSPDNVLVAVNPRDENHVWGWLCFSGSVIHYAWVRHEYRRVGIFRLLLAKSELPTHPLHCSHWTRLCEVVQGKWQLAYVPTAALPPDRKD